MVSAFERWRFPSSVLEMGCRVSRVYWAKSNRLRLWDQERAKRSTWTRSEWEQTETWNARDVNLAIAADHPSETVCVHGGDLAGGTGFWQEELQFEATVPALNEQDEMSYDRDHCIIACTGTVGTRAKQGDGRNDTHY